MADWVIYGRNGLTGELIAGRPLCRCSDRSWRRNAERVPAWAAELGLPQRVFSGPRRRTFPGLPLSELRWSVLPAQRRPVIAAALAAHVLP